MTARINDAARRERRRAEEDVVADETLSDMMDVDDDVETKLRKQRDDLAYVARTPFVTEAAEEDALEAARVTAAATRALRGDRDARGPEAGAQGEAVVATVALDLHENAGHETVERLADLPGSDNDDSTVGLTDDSDGDMRPETEERKGRGERLTSAPSRSRGRRGRETFTTEDSATYAALTTVDERKEF